MALSGVDMKTQNASLLSLRADISYGGCVEPLQLSAFLHRTPPYNTMMHATHFSYQSFMDIARSRISYPITGWTAIVGDSSWDNIVTSEGEWHRVILYAHQVELLKARPRGNPNDRTAILFQPVITSDFKKSLKRRKPLYGIEDDSDNSSPKASHLPSDSRLSDIIRSGKRTRRPSPETPAVTKDNFLESLREAATGEGLYSKDAIHYGVTLEDLAQYYGVTPDKVNEIQLMGTTRRLHLHEALFVLIYLKRLDGTQEELRGQFLLEDTGRGRTACCLALMAELRGIEIEADHVRANPEMHLSSGDSRSDETRCPTGGPRAAGCVCVTGSIRSRWAARLFGGPFIVVVHDKKTQGQWLKEAEEYLYPYIGKNGKGQASKKGADLTEFILPCFWKGWFMRTTDTSHGQDDEHFKREVLGQLEVLGAPTAAGDTSRTMPHTDASSLSEAMAADDGAKCRDAGLRVHANTNKYRMRRLTPGSKLLVLSSTVLKQTGKDNFFQKVSIVTRISIQQQGKPDKSHRLSWTPGFAPTLVVIDESHQQMGKKALVYMMKRILAVAIREEEKITRVPFWLFASATPWKDGLSATDTWLPFVCQNSAKQKKGMAKELVQQHHGLEEAFESDDRMDLEGLATLRRSVELLFGSMTIARREGTSLFPTANS